MITAQFAKKASLAIILSVAALVFVQSTEAASGNTQICQPNTPCTIGEFLYNDSYSPITTASCNITSRYPNGTLLLNNLSMPVSPEGDGWYAHIFNTPVILGLYRTEVKCVTGNETLALDKSFEVKVEGSTLSSGDIAGAVWNADRNLFNGSGTFGRALQNIVPGTNDIASAVWGYSSRSLTTFGNLASDIWGSATRTLTGATLSSGSLATKDDVSTTTTITNTQNITNNTTNNLLEQLLNKPTVDNSLDDTGFTTTELQTKIDKSEKLANQLLATGGYIKSKNNLALAKLNDSKSLEDVAAVIGQDIDTSDKKSLFGQIAWIKQQWGFPVSAKLYDQNKKLSVSIQAVNRKLSVAALKNFSAEVDSFMKLVGTSDDSPKMATLFGALKSQKELSSSFDKNYTEADELLASINKNAKSPDLISKINVLGTHISSINLLPQADKIILTQANDKMDQKQLTNKTLSLRGIVSANRQFLSQVPNQPLRSLWLEMGSVIFKTLISNPSKSISQKVPVKYYLPKEVTRENITNTDQQLTVNYDSEKDQYYVSGQFELAPGETKTVSVTVDDSAFHISDADIATMRKQAEELSKPLKNSAYFAQGVTLKSDIDVSLDKIDSLQKNAATPEAKIRGYREAMIEYKAAQAKLDKLKELATTAGSVGTLFGFVGGAQTLAVWGLIIIMVAGFVFLALYMRTIRNGEKYSAETRQKFPPLIEDTYENMPSGDSPAAQKPIHHKFPIGKSIKLAVILIAACSILGGGAFSALAVRQKQLPPSPQAIVPQEVLGINTTDQKAPEPFKEINIFVPSDSAIAVFTDPTLNSPVLATLSASRPAKETGRQGAWVNVEVVTIEGKTVKGWVDKDFIDAEMETKKIQGAALPFLEKVTVTDTPTGFLRVRKAPGGVEITKISPGEEYLAKGEEAVGWVQIALEDGTSGWVAKQYVK